jgi:hypothetical protein
MPGAPYPRRAARLGVAVVLASAAAAVYPSFVHPDFRAIRQAVVTADLRASPRTVRVVLPDLSELHGHRPVFVLRLHNGAPEDRRITVSLGGFPLTRVALAAGGAVRSDLVTAPGVVEALAAAVGESARSIELSGNGDGWILRGLEVRNYHGRAGPLGIVVVPARTRPNAPFGDFIIVAVCLGGLVLLTAIAGSPSRMWTRRTCYALTVAAFLCCVGFLVLPAVSAYKVLIARPTFWVIVAGLFSSAVLHETVTLVMWTGRLLRPLAAGAVLLIHRTAQRVAVPGGFWARHEVTLERGAALLGLTAVGVAQPVFEVVAGSPEFFVARNTTPIDAVAAVLAICFGIPILLIAIERLVRMRSRRAATLVHGATLAILAAAVVMPWLERGGIPGWPWDAVMSSAVGLAVAAAYVRSRLARHFLTALAAAAFVVPGAFLLDGTVRGALRTDDAAAAPYVLARTPPIVLVVFDEFPLNSLLDEHQQIDAGRYPNFAAFARNAYWFRNAGTVSSETVWAVPSILSGQYPTTPHAVPTLRYYPHNLFTILADQYEMFAFARFRKLCPAGTCHHDPAIPRDSVPSLLSDLGIVWLHVVLPQPFTDKLPAIAGDWIGFARAGAGPPRPRGRSVRAAEFAAFLSSIDRQPARLYFIHVLLPHMPFEYVPSGRAYRAPDYQTRTERGKPLFQLASPAYADTLHQRHLAQVGYVDRLVGDLLARLREMRVYDAALVVLTADHGASHREGRVRRAATGDNLSDIIRVPLFIKVPGQRNGAVVDRIVETVDILPTILDVLSARLPVKLDGRSLLDADLPERPARTFIFRGRARVVPRLVEDLSVQSAVSLERKVRRFGTGDSIGLYATPGTGHLLRTEAIDSRRAEGQFSPFRIAIHDLQRFAAVDLDRDPLPLYVRGIITPVHPEPLTIAVAVNGIVASTIESYQEGDSTVFGTLIPEELLRDGDNAVEAFVIDGDRSVGSPTNTCR